MMAPGSRETRKTMTDDSEPAINSDELPTTPAVTNSNVDFGSPTGRVALGGMILVGVYIIFGLFLNDYWVGWVALLLAISGIFLVFKSEGTFIESLAPVPVLVKIVGYLLFAVGLLTVIEDLRFASGGLNEVTEVIGAVAGYAGYALAFLGARSIKI
jgi:hypothetical protein